MTTPIEVFAPAKVNLTLHVVGRRDDGYHLLDSLVAFAGVGDTIQVAEAADLTLEIDGPEAAGLSGTPAADNIVLKAARRLAETCGIAGGAAIRLTKRLPVASGIGGGSTDAAATLHALCRLWGLDLDSRRLAAIGLALGADVPVCLAARPAVMAGIGEHLSPAPHLPPAALLLVNPRVGVPTPAVFKARAASGADYSLPHPLTRAPADAAELAQLLAARRNDLTDAAIGLSPVIGDVLAEVSALPGCRLARMSGSGATCFGLFDDLAAAEAAAALLSTRRPDWWRAAAPLLT